MQRATENWILLAVDRFERPLLRFATRLVGASRASDVVQEAFLQLCRQDRTTVEGHLAAWLFTVTRHRALDVLRSSRRAEPMPQGDEMRSPDSGPQSKAERREVLSHLQRLVDELPERERQAVLLRFSGGLSYQEIADTMQISVSNVGFILHTAMKSIRSELSSAAEGGVR